MFTELMPLIQHRPLTITVAANSAICIYQTSHRFSAGRTIAEPALHENALANGGMFESGPMTRYFATGCSSPWIILRANSGRSSSPRTCPQAMKNCWSGVKPSTSGAGVYRCGPRIRKFFGVSTNREEQSALSSVPND